MSESGLPAFATFMKKFIEEKLAEGGSGNGAAEEKVEELQNEVEDLKNQMAELKAEGSGLPKVMFQAYRRQEGDSAEGSIDFEEVTLNYGEGFDGETFTAPIAGVYTFSFFGISSQQNSDGRVNVNKNDALAFMIYDGNETNNYNQMGATFHLHLDAGDTVGLSAGNPIHTGSGFPAQFSGRLVCKDD